MQLYDIVWIWKYKSNKKVILKYNVLTISYLENCSKYFFFDVNKN